MNFTAWYDDVLPDVTNCMPELALKHIRQAAIRFCEESGALVGSISPINVVALTSVYTLSVPNRDVCGINDAFIDGQPLLPKSRDWLIENFGNIDNVSTARKAKYFYQDRLDKIIIAPPPDSSGVLTLNVCLKPTRNATEIDDFIFTTYFDAIAHGAKATLFEIPKKPFTDNEMAAYHSQKFSEYASEARNAMSTGLNNRTPKRVKVW